MNENEIPDSCSCGGQVEYWNTKDGEEAWNCKSCHQVYLRYIDCPGG